MKSTGIDLQDKLCAMPTCVDLFLTSEEQEDVPGRLAQVNLHDRYKSCVQIVVLGCLRVQRVNREGSTRDLEDHGVVEVS